MLSQQAAPAVMCYICHIIERLCKLIKMASPPSNCNLRLVNKGNFQAPRGRFPGPPPAPQKSKSVLLQYYSNRRPKIFFRQNPKKA